MSAPADAAMVVRQLSDRRARPVAQCCSPELPPRRSAAASAVAGGGTASSGDLRGVVGARPARAVARSGHSLAGWTSMRHADLIVDLKSREVAANPESAEEFAEETAWRRGGRSWARRETRGVRRTRRRRRPLPRVRRRRRGRRSRSGSIGPRAVAGRASARAGRRHGSVSPLGGRCCWANLPSTWLLLPLNRPR